MERIARVMTELVHECYLESGSYMLPSSCFAKNHSEEEDVLLSLVRIIHLDPLDSFNMFGQSMTDDSTNREVNLQSDWVCFPMINRSLL